MLHELPPHLPPTPPPLAFPPAVVGHSTNSPDHGVDEAIRTPEDLFRLRDEYGDQISLSRAGKLHFLFGTPAETHSVLVSKAKHFIKGDGERLLAQLLGWGILTDENDTHRKSSRAIGPALRPSSLDTAFPFIKEQIRGALELASSAPVPLLDWTRTIAQRVTEGVLFSRLPASIDDEYQRRAYRVSELVHMGATDSTESYLAKSDSALVDLRHMRCYVDELIDEARHDSRQESNLFGHILSAADSNAEISVHGQVAQFLFESVDTIGALLAWSVLFLNDNPQYLHEIRTEINESPRSLHEQSPRAIYPVTNAVIRETLRLRPPVWMIPRTVTSPVIVGNQPMAIGSRVIVSPALIHHDERFFRDSKLFSPTRWLSAPPPNNVFFPFGKGSRICMGSHFGTLAAEAFLLLFSTDISSFKLLDTTLEPGQTSVVWNPRDSVRIQLDM